MPLNTSTLSVASVPPPTKEDGSSALKNTLYMNTSLFKKLGTAPPVSSKGPFISAESRVSFKFVFDRAINALSSESVPVLSKVNVLF